MFTSISDNHKTQKTFAATAKGEACTTDAHNCCTPKPKGKQLCPRCGHEARGVLPKTLEHLLTRETKNHLDTLEAFYYCTTPACAVIYFRDQTVLTQKDVMVTVGCKEGAEPQTVCYCFGWTGEKIRRDFEERGRTSALDDIKAKMKDPGCSCEILNPSGGCCLGDVTKTIKRFEHA